MRAELIVWRTAGAVGSTSATRRELRAPTAPGKTFLPELITFVEKEKMIYLFHFLGLSC